jgi:hypothetical protein
MINKEIEYILLQLDKYKQLDLRKDYFFFSDLETLKEIYPTITTIIDKSKMIIWKIIQIVLISSIFIAVTFKPKDSPKWWATAIITSLYFAAGSYYIKL